MDPTEKESETLTQSPKNKMTEISVNLDEDLEMVGHFDGDDAKARMRVSSHAKTKGYEFYNKKTDFELILLSHDFPPNFAIPQIACHILDERKKDRERNHAWKLGVGTAILGGLLAWAGTRLGQDSGEDQTQLEKLEELDAQLKMLKQQTTSPAKTRQGERAVPPKSDRAGG